MIDYAINFFENYDELNIKQSNLLIFDKDIIKDDINNICQKEPIIIKKAKKTSDCNELSIFINVNNDYKFCKSVIKKIEKILRKNTSIKIVYYIKNRNLKYGEDIVNCIKAMHMRDKKEKYIFIYDVVCDYLDNEFKKCDFCNFKNDKCIANREGMTKYKEMGCCYSFELTKLSDFRFIKNERLCTHMKNRKCDTKNISCKLFTCGYLKSKNIRYNTHKILILDIFFNKKQHDIINLNFFKTKEEILNKILEVNKDPYIWYLFRRKYLIARPK